MLLCQGTKWWWWDVKASTSLATSTVTNVSSVRIFSVLLELLVCDVLPNVVRVSLTMRILYMHYHLRLESSSSSSSCCLVDLMCNRMFIVQQWSIWLSCVRGWTPIRLVVLITSELLAGSSGGLLEVKRRL